MSTGYDVLSLLQAGFQDALEAGDRAPSAAFSFSGTQQEGSAIAFDASASSDPDLGRTDLGRAESLSYAWQFGDGTTATGQTASHAYTNDGSFIVTLTVSDAFGWQKTTTRTVAIANVAPAVSLSATSPVSILSGDAVSVAGSFTDPGSDAPWQSVLAWGDRPRRRERRAVARGERGAPAGDGYRHAELDPDDRSGRRHQGDAVLRQPHGRDAARSLHRPRRRGRGEREEGKGQRRCGRTEHHAAIRPPGAR
ncbi:MAG: PKD domain-containing protein [Gemmatimonadetes bacterium]|nr:PKD domain-containing protein [Gemmatimonadota bacterium]